MPAGSTGAAEGGRAGEGEWMGGRAGHSGEPRGWREAPLFCPYSVASGPMD